MQDDAPELEEYWPAAQFVHNEVLQYSPAGHESEHPAKTGKIRTPGGRFVDKEANIKKKTTRSETAPSATAIRL